MIIEPLRAVPDVGRWGSIRDHSSSLSQSTSRVIQTSGYYWSA